MGSARFSSIASSLGAVVLAALVGCTGEDIVEPGEQGLTVGDESNDVAAAPLPAATSPTVDALCQYPTSVGTNTRKVHFVYLAPTDRPAKQKYITNLARAAQNIQIFYRNQMGNGKTFSLTSPVVTVVSTPHNAAWYSTNVNGDNPAYYFYLNLLADGLGPTGGSFNDPNNIWLYYLDADPVCGSITGGTQGVATFPANDLRGVSGESSVPACPTDPVETPNPCRWVGGAGHEIGHAFNLPHPPGCDAGSPSCDFNALMYTGYAIYPSTYLRDDNKASLNANPFLTVTSLPTSSCSCSEVSP